MYAYCERRAAVYDETRSHIYYMHSVCAQKYTASHPVADEYLPIPFTEFNINVTLH